MSVSCRTSLTLALLFGCGGGLTEGGQKTKKPLPVAELPIAPKDPTRSVGKEPVLLRGATLMTAEGVTFAHGFILLRDGLIVALGEGSGPAEADARVIDVAGKFITPGLIDTHSHLGVYPSPAVSAHQDGNESVAPTTAEVWAEHAFWPQDPDLRRAIAGGVTTIQVLPGSANLIGGRSFIAKLTPKTSAREMRFVGAKQGVKMACGENPKRVYGDKGGPRTRMGNVAGYREAFQRAREYQRNWQKYERDLAAWREHHDEDEDPPEPPARDLALETLAAVLAGDLLVHNHCYRADEMHIMLDLAREFGFSIRSFHHALEAYKLADRLAAESVAVSTWADWWGFKMEALDGVPQNAALVAKAGGRAIMHSDSATEIRYLNQEAAKARTAGAKVGINFSDDDVLRWITKNPAWALGLEDKVGTLSVGKMADVVVWDQHPFSVYAKTQYVFIDGELVFDRAAPPRLSDFELGQSAESLP